MCKITGRLTVYYADPFWVGVYERECGGWYEVGKLTFGAEPSDSEIYELLLHTERRLTFSPPIRATLRDDTRNPKRKQRQARQLVGQRGIGTKAQQALAAARETRKTERQSQKRTDKKQQAAAKFAQAQHKRREKHKGH